MMMHIYDLSPGVCAVPGGLHLLLLQALLGLPVCPFFLEYASLVFQLLVLSIQVFFHLFMTPLKLITEQRTL